MNDKPRVYLLNIDTGQQEVLGDFPGMTFAPRFSPDANASSAHASREGMQDNFDALHHLAMVKFAEGQFAEALQLIAGAMRVGEVAHRLETAIEQRLAAADHASLDRHDIEPLQARVDVIQTWFEQLIQDDTQRYAAEQAQAEATAAVPLVCTPALADGVCALA